MNVTIQDLVSELGSFGPIPDTLENLNDVDINTGNRKVFKQLVDDWARGVYDEDPDALLFELECLVNR
jgi:hypothetical protein